MANMPFFSVIYRTAGVRPQAAVGRAPRPVKPAMTPENWAHLESANARPMTGSAKQSTPASFRDGPKDQTRNLEIPGSRLRAPRNDWVWIARRWRSSQ
jgi:hypothetical protein